MKRRFSHMMAFMESVCARGTEAPLATLRVVQGLKDLQLGVGDLLTDQLGDPVSLLHHKLSVRVVEHDNT